uniref:Uncharacterized protein n=1 Tax=Oryza sativa subsp. japonica TaxID=39947 RepID=Q6ZF33_ORYSJ|nr:hypothetical protein [Oryza sativa Japonica Group]BAD31157.1 hypothetical protein [Oryza sativa Japonica Group]
MEGWPAAVDAGARGGAAAAVEAGSRGGAAMAAGEAAFRGGAAAAVDAGARGGAAAAVEASAHGSAAGDGGGRPAREGQPATAECGAARRGATEDSTGEVVVVGGWRRRRCDQAARSYTGSLVEAATMMATLDRLVRGRGDPSFSLTLFLSNPTTWMEWKRNGGRDSSLMAGRRRGVGAAAARRRGFAGGSAEADMHSLARESRTMGEDLAFRPAAVTPT